MLPQLDVFFVVVIVFFLENAKENKICGSREHTLYSQQTYSFALLGTEVKLGSGGSH
jgi:hypothetical protein